VVDYLATTPRAFLFGLGPDISIRGHDLPLLQRLFLGAGVQQEAVDNGYLYLALNFGVPALAAGLGIAGGTLWRLTRRLLDWPDVTALGLWLTIIVWLAMSVTQQCGSGKPVLYFAQAVALADWLALQRRKPEHDARLEAPTP
jgi:hypothetical protein